MKYTNIFGRSVDKHLALAPEPCSGFGASAKCSSLNDNEMAFVSSLRENLLRQHVLTPTRQRGIDTPHILDLVITSEDSVSEITHLSPLGMSDHCILKFTCQQHIQHYRTLRAH